MKTLSGSFLKYNMLSDRKFNAPITNNLSCLPILSHVNLNSEKKNYAQNINNFKFIIFILKISLSKEWFLNNLLHVYINSRLTVLHFNKF